MPDQSFTVKLPVSGDPPSVIWLPLTNPSSEIATPVVLKELFRTVYEPLRM
jgi:hypothetical protein